MYHKIGSAAGDVWRFLDSNGPTTINQLKTEMKKGPSEMDGPLVDRAIGWLAREGKISMEQKGKSSIIEAIM